MRVYRDQGNFQLVSGEDVLTFKLPDESEGPTLECLFCKYFNYDDACAKYCKVNLCNFADAGIHRILGNIYCFNLRGDLEISQLLGIFNNKVVNYCTCSREFFVAWICNFGLRY